jgi:hypothetical protein
MLSQARVAAVRQRVPYATQATAVDPDASVLQLAGEVRGEHALIIGAGGLELMCSLLRKGAAEVKLLRQGVRPEHAAADLAIATGIDSQDSAQAAIAHARRALADSGRLILRVVADPTGHLAQSIAQTLRLHGFSAVRVRRAGGCSLVAGALPWFGPTTRH